MTNMPRFVVLEHDHPERHWDFMLEAGDVLRTWRLAACPEPGRSVYAEASFDHRPLYLDYQGAVSGGRGTVVRWDAGTFTWMEETPDLIAVQLQGERLCGHAQIARDPEGQWFLRVEGGVRTISPGI
jgi:hypothetical protein